MNFNFSICKSFFQKGLYFVNIDGASHKEIENFIQEIKNQYNIDFTRYAENLLILTERN